MHGLKTHRGAQELENRTFFLFVGNIKSIVSIAGDTARPLFFEVVVEWLFFIFWGEGCFGASSDGKADEGSVGVKMRGNVQLDVL